MGHRCCSKQKIKRGLWSPEEDEKLVRYINTHGHKSWSSVPKFAGMMHFFFRQNLHTNIICIVLRSEMEFHFDNSYDKSLP